MLSPVTAPLCDNLFINFSFSICGGSAGIQRRLNVAVNSSGDVGSSTENMEDKRKMSPLSLSCNDTMPHM